MNWAFAYSDRTEQPFGKGIGEHPPMAKELEKYKPLLREADEGIHALALGQTPPPEAENGAAGGEQEIGTGPGHHERGIRPGGEGAAGKRHRTCRLIAERVVSPAFQAAGRDDP